MTDLAGYSYSARHPSQLLALCVFLTFSAAAFQSQRWCRTCSLAPDDASWADPWMRRWIAEQEVNQNAPELSPGLNTPCVDNGITSLPRTRHRIRFKNSYCMWKQGSCQRRVLLHLLWHELQVALRSLHPTAEPVFAMHRHCSLFKFLPAEQSRACIMPLHIMS